MAEEDIRVTFQKYVAQQRVKDRSPPPVSPEIGKDGWLKSLMKRCLNRMTRGEYKSAHDQWADY